MKNILILTMATLIVAGTASADLIGYWNFEEGAGAVADNLAHTAGDAVLQGGAGWSTNTPDGSNYALDLSLASGDNAVVSVHPDYYISQIGNAYREIPITDATWEFDMYALESQGDYWSQPFNNEGLVDIQYNHYYANNGAMRAWNWDWNDYPAVVGPTVNSSPISVAVNQWTHVAVVWKEATKTLSLWIDGFEAGSITNTGCTAGGYDITFGSAKGAPNTENFMGLIDNVKIWNEAVYPVTIPEPVFLGLGLVALLHRKKK